MKITVIDRNPELIKAFQEAFEDSEVDLSVGSFLDFKADAIVSPANSFGYMDGGIDLAYETAWPGTQERVQAEILKLPFGELLVGQALAIELPSNDNFRNIVVAPTMRIPSAIPPYQVYLATRAAVAMAITKGYESLIIPGMGTGAGRVNGVVAGWCIHKGIRDAVIQNLFPNGYSKGWQGVASSHIMLGKPFDFTRRR